MNENKISEVLKKEGQYPLENKKIVAKTIEAENNSIVDTVGFFGDIVSGLGNVLTPIVSLFGAKYTAPVIAVSEIAKQFGKLNDKDVNVLQNNVIGLSKIIDLIEDDVTKSKRDNISYIKVDHVESWLVELKSINELRKLNNKILD